MIVFFLLFAIFLPQLMLRISLIITGTGNDFSRKLSGGEFLTTSDFFEIRRFQGLMS